MTIKVNIKNKAGHYFYKNANGSYFIRTIPNPHSIKRPGNASFTNVVKNNKNLPNFFKNIEKPTNRLNIKGQPIFTIKKAKMTVPEAFYFHRTAAGKLEPAVPHFIKHANGTLIPVWLTNSGLKTNKNVMIWKNRGGRLFQLNGTKQIPIKKLATIFKNNKTPIKSFRVTGQESGFYNKKKEPIFKNGATFFPSGVKAYYIKNNKTGNIRNILNNNVVPAILNIKIVAEKLAMKKAFDLFIKGLESDDKKRFTTYYIPMFTKLFKFTPTVSKQSWHDTPHYINVIGKKIGPCHLSLTANWNTKQKYLPQLFNQLMFIVNEFNKLSDVRQTKFLDVYADKLAGRPCLENALHEGVESLVDPTFNWTGKNLKNPLNKNNKVRYLHNVIRPALLSWTASLNNSNRKTIVNMNLNQRKNVFWQKIKNKNLHVMSNRGPGYAAVKTFDKNGTIFKNSNLASQLEWLNY